MKRSIKSPDSAPQSAPASSAGQKGRPKRCPTSAAMYAASVYDNVNAMWNRPVTLRINPNATPSSAYDEPLMKPFAVS